jgi:hypothetical protein
MNRPRRVIKLPSKYDDYIVEPEIPDEEEDQNDGEWHFYENDEDELPYGKVDEVTPYPFSTKTPRIHIKTRLNRIPDTKLSNLRKFYRPYFSPYHHSWELDYFNTGIVDEKYYRMYLIFININTKFIVVYPLQLNQPPSSDITLSYFVDFANNFTVTNIRGDDDTSFQGGFIEYLDDHNIRSFFSSSPYTNKNRVVDRAIRTIKDAVGVSKHLLLFPSLIEEIVYYYNNTPHKAFKNIFTPYEVQNDKEIENWYIRQQQARLLNTLKIQRLIPRYKHNNVLLVHLPLDKTPNRFKKRRRNFDEVGQFLEYANGNCVVQLSDKSVVTVPIYYTQYMAENSDQFFEKKTRIQRDPSKRRLMGLFTKNHQQSLFLFLEEYNQ